MKLTITGFGFAHRRLIVALGRSAFCTECRGFLLWWRPCGYWGDRPLQFTALTSTARNAPSCLGVPSPRVVGIFKAHSFGPLFVKRPRCECGCCCFGCAVDLCIAIQESVGAPFGAPCRRWDLVLSFTFLSAFFSARDLCACAVLNTTITVHLHDSPNAPLFSSSAIASSHLASFRHPCQPLCPAILLSPGFCFGDSAVTTRPPLHWTHERDPLASS